MPVDSQDLKADTTSMTSTWDRPHGGLLQGVSMLQTSIARKTGSYGLIRLRYLASGVLSRESRPARDGTTFPHQCPS